MDTNEDWWRTTYQDSYEHKSTRQGLLTTESDIHEFSYVHINN